MSMPYSQIKNHDTRLALERLDEIINLLGAQGTIFDLVLRGLVAGCVPMAPALSQTIPVTILPTFLVENTVASLARVEITNDDLAIPLYIGNRDVIVPGGRLVQPQDTVAYELRKGQRLYGIVPIGTVVVIISFSDSAYQGVTDGPVVM